MSALSRATIMPAVTVNRTRLSAPGTTVPAESTIANRTRATSPGAAVTVSRSGVSRRAGGAHFRLTGDNAVPGFAHRLEHARLVGHVPAQVQVTGRGVDHRQGVGVPPP